MTNSKDSLITDAALLSQAEKLCKQRVEQAPENRAALRSLAEVYRKMGNLAGAATTYERLFSLDPQDQEAGYMQAVLGGKEWPHAPDGVRAAPFVLLKGFLPREFHDALLPFMMSVQGQMIPMLDGDGAYNPDSRQALEFQGEWDKRRFRDALAAVLARVIPRLYLPCFPIGQIEVQMCVSGWPLFPSPQGRGAKVAVRQSGHQLRVLLSQAAAPLRGRRVAPI